MLTFICNSCKQQAKFSLTGGSGAGKNGDSVTISPLDVERHADWAHICGEASCLLDQLEIRKLHFQLTLSKPEIANA